MESNAIQYVFNLLISLAVFGFVIYRRESLKEIMPFWTLLTPIIFMVLLELEFVVSLFVGIDNDFLHRLIFLLLVTSLLVLAWHLPIHVRTEREDT